MKTKPFYNISSMIILASLLAGLLGGLPLQAAHAAGAAPAPLQASYDCSTNTQIPQAECAALVALYNSTNLYSNNWYDNTDWLSTTTPCSWYGVSCDAGNTHVTGLSLSNNGLTGSIPDEIGDLTQLTTLQMDNNWFMGNGIPVTLGNLTHLTQLSLNTDDLSSTIPTTLGSMAQLTSLDLSHNTLNGAIPTTLGSLAQLTSLNLSDNRLTGTLPTGIGSSTQLQSLYVNNNFLKGLLPTSLTGLGDLNAFNFDCDLTTSDASLIAFLNGISSGWSTSCHTISGNAGIDGVSLQYTDGLDKTVTSEVDGSYTIRVPDGWDGRVWPYKDSYAFTPSYLDYSTTPGPVASDLTGQDYTAELVGCDQQGEIPPAECEALLAFYDNVTDNGWNMAWGSDNHPCNWYGVTCSAGHVTSIDLNREQLSGNIAPELGNLTQLTYLDLSYNFLGGNIPPQLGNLSKLQYLDLSYNWEGSSDGMRGNIPAELGNLKQLVTLNLQYNHLEGTIPSELGGMTHLADLELQENMLTGNIPSTLGNLKQLTSINLSNNRLSGNIPPELGNLAQLTALNLADNIAQDTDGLSGNIPHELSNLTQLTSLNLGGNGLTGGIPSWLGGLTQLTYLDLSFNPLMGNIPTQISNLKQLYSVSLRADGLSGSIPSQLGSLTQLTYLDLDTNELSGSIPPELGNLAHLGNLDLSYNELTGSLPTEIGNLAQLEIIIVNSNYLQGTLPPSLANLSILSHFEFDCELVATDPALIAFLNGIASDWHSCHVLSGSTGLGGVTLTYHDVYSLMKTVTSEVDGSYTIRVPDGWDGTITPSRTGYTFTPASKDYSVAPGPVVSDLAGQDYSATTNTYTLSGSVGMAGVSLSYTGGSPVTSASDGTYQISVPYGWTGTVTPSKAGYTFTPVSKDYSVAPGPVVSNLTGQDYSASIITYTLSGNVGMAGVSLSYTGGSSPVTSASDGSYQISVPYGWAGTVTPSRTGYTFTPPSKDYSTSPVSSNLTGQNYTAAINAYNLSGNAGTGGATISFSGGSAPVTSAADGTYQISVPYGWSGTVTPSKTGYTFTPPSKDYSAAPGPVVSGLSSQNYTASATNFSATLKSSAAQDGWILESSRLSSKGGSMNAKATTINLGDDAARKQYLGILSFDSGAALPDNAVVTSVNLKFKKQSVVGGGNPVSIFKGFMADIKDGSFNLPALETKDFQAASHSYGPFSPALAGGWYSLDLSAGSAFINDLGLTQIRLHFKLGDNGNAVANYLAIFSGNAPAASQPQLVITYHLP